MRNRQQTAVGHPNPKPRNGCACRRSFSASSVTPRVYRKARADAREDRAADLPFAVRRCSAAISVGCTYPWLSLRRMAPSAIRKRSSSTALQNASGVRNSTPARRIGMTSTTAEHAHLQEDANRTKNWKRWGPCLSERQWARHPHSPGRCESRSGKSEHAFAAYALVP